MQFRNRRLRLRDALPLLLPLVGLLIVVLLLRGNQSQPSAAEQRAVWQTYQRIVSAAFAEADSATRELNQAVRALIRQPSETTLTAAQSAWITAKALYSQAELGFYGDPLMNNWIEQVSGWPVSTSVLDYIVVGLAGPNGTVPTEMDSIDTEMRAAAREQHNNNQIDIAKLRESGRDAGYRISGFPAVEYLLWGGNSRELDVSDRSWTDFAVGSDCMNGNDQLAPAHLCQHRRELLQSAAALLVSDLNAMSGQAWSIDDATSQSEPGLHTLLSKLHAATTQLAHTQLRQPLRSHDPASAQDRFSNNTHNTLYYSNLGIDSIYHGRLIVAPDQQISGPSVSSLLAEHDPKLSAQLEVAFVNSHAALAAIRDAAEQRRQTFSRLIAPGNDEGSGLISKAIDALESQAVLLERVAHRFELEIQ